MLRIDGSIKLPVQRNKSPTERGRQAFHMTEILETGGSSILHTFCCCASIRRLINVMQINLNLSLSSQKHQTPDQ